MFISSAAVLMMMSMILPLPSPANYSAEKTTVDGIEVVRLRDASRQTEVSIVPSLGNNAYEFKVGGKNIMWSPYQSLKELKENPVQAGNPLLAPWANRIDSDGYWANGKRYSLNPELGNFRRDGNRKPIHGLLVFSDAWVVIGLHADAGSATVTSRLEFWRCPDLMAQFPFAHTITVTHTLENGSLEVQTEIQNLSSASMPLSLGYHTYYRLHDAARDDWRVHVPARSQVAMSQELIPTGELTPTALADPYSLHNSQLDAGFAGLIRDAAGRAEFWVQGRKQKIRVLFGPKYDIGIVYAPPGRDFICFEPMVGVTNVFNLAHAGRYKDLQSIPPGGSWKESFWIIPEGFE